MQRRPSRQLPAPLSALLPSSALGILLGALAFAAALTPSLIPRAGLLQGLLAGASFVAGYLVVYLGQTLWSLLHLRVWRGDKAEIARILITGVACAVMIWALSNATPWQDALHRVMGLPPVESARPFTIAFSAFSTIIVLTVLGRLFRNAVLWFSAKLAPMMPARLAMLLGFVAVVFTFNVIANDVLLSRVLSALDETYARLDAALPPEKSPPQNPDTTGGAASLVKWESLGAEGRNRVADPLDLAEISRITGAQAHEPLRIFVGLGSAKGPKARAELALAEAIRQGAFERDYLVIATPTGTGWVDPSAMMPLEVLLGGNLATISVQYSYLPSWLSLLTVPEYGAEQARAVFTAIHGHWASLPAETRPKLYLFGLSLGALNSDLSSDFYDLVAAPYQGALWVGPPFGSRSWGHITSDRLPESPEWLPRFRDGQVVRFLNQYDMPDAGKDWAPLRIVYLQYASDPISFFSPSILWREPDWLAGPRGPDVIESFRWLPIVTFLQVGFDVMTATTTPMGHGHVYAGRDYMRGWQAVLPELGHSAEVIEKLERAMAARGL